jgi:hypothetical protein
LSAAGEVRAQFLFGQLSIAVLVERLQRSCGIVDLFGRDLAVLVGIERDQNRKELHDVPTRTTPSRSSGTSAAGTTRSALAATFGATTSRRASFRALSIRPAAEQQSNSGGQNGQLLGFSHEKLQLTRRTLRMCSL